MKTNFLVFFFFRFIHFKETKGRNVLTLNQMLKVSHALFITMVCNLTVRQPEPGTRSNLQKFAGEPASATLTKFFKRLQKQGKTTNKRVLENFLMYVKWKFQVNPVAFLTERFFLQYELPFYLEVVTFSNRNYMFPEPFANYQMSQKFFVKKFGNVIKKRSETFYLNRIFTELLHFFNPNQQSYLRDSLDAVMHQGLENRAYVHYRWLVRK